VAGQEADTKRERLLDLENRMKKHFPQRRLWFFEGDDEVAGYLGTEPVMFVGKNPSLGGRRLDRAGRAVRGGNAPQVLARFYARLKEYGFARAHVTDIVKEAMPVRVPLSDEQVERNWPFFREELSIVEPAVVVALGGWVFKTLERRLGRQRPLLGFTHYAYRFKSRSELEQIFREDFERLRIALANTRTAQPWR
jgi:uracil-DNA glycosylase